MLTNLTSEQANRSRAFYSKDADQKPLTSEDEITQATEL